MVVTGKLMPCSGRGAGGLSGRLSVLCCLGNRLVMRGRWPLSPSLATCPVAHSPVIRGSLCPMWGILCPAWPVLVQPPSVGVTLPAVQQLGMSRSGSLSSASRPQQYLQRKFPVEQGFSALALQTFGGGSFSVVGAVLCSVGRLPASKCHRIPEATLVHL